MDNSSSETSSSGQDEDSDLDTDELIRNDWKDGESPEVSSSRSKLYSYKNLLVISMSFFITFGVYLSEIGLQSSINEDNELGLASLSIVYGSFILSCLFSSTVISLIGTKYTMIIGYCGMTFYTIANFYPSWYTLVPGSIVVGCIFGPLWSSQAVHITSIARQYAHDFGKKQEQIVFLFFGIYVFILKMAYVPPNIISSVVLLIGRSSNTSIIDDSEICNNTDAAHIDPKYFYILLSIYLVFDLVAILVLVVFVDRLKTEIKFSSLSKVLHNNVKNPIINTLKLVWNWKVNVLFIMMLLDGYSISFIIGIFLKVYVSDCIGIYWIGFCQCCFGIGSAVSAFLNGFLVRYVPQYILVYIGVLVNVATIIFLFIWERQPSYYIVFIVLLLWGYSEGLWNSVPPSVVGVLSHKDKDSAQSYSRMGMAVGFTVGFVCAIFLDIKVMLWIDLGLLIIALISYSVLMFVTQPMEKLLPCCKKKQYVTEEMHKLSEIAS